ncbi:YfhO family protein [Candidatus Woesearchaeota archaeon]|nr:YfhO family protein [Candidatus Woesearchaeota archaeon]
MKVVYDKKTDIKYIILLFAVALALFWKIILSPNHVLWSPVSELVTDIAYWDNFRHESMRDYGEIPLWAPYTFSGYPFIGNHWSKLLYPTNLLYLFVPSLKLYGYVFLLHFFLGGVFLYLFMNKIGVSKFSSFISSVIYILCLKYSYYVFAGFVGREVTMLILPLLFYLIECYFQSRKSVYLIAASVASAFQFFGDHNQIFLYSWLVVFLYYIYRAFVIERERVSFRNAIKYIGIFFLMSTLVLMISAAQLFPLLEFVSKVSRLEGLDFVSSSVGSYPPHYLITLLFPEFFGSYFDGTYWGIFAFWKMALYIGILSLIFVMMNIYKTNKYSRFFILLGVISLIFSMGKYTPLYYFLYKYVPLLTIFRIPAKLLLFFNFSLILLAGFGLDLLLYKLNSRKLSIMLRGAAILLVFSLAGLAFVFLFEDRILMIGSGFLKNKLSANSVSVNSYEFYHDKLPGIYNHIVLDVLLFSIFLLLSVIILKLKINNVNVKFIKALIFFVILMDLGVHSMPLIQVKSISEAYPENKLVSFMASDKDFFRFVDINFDILRQERLIGTRLFKMEGFDGLIYEDYQKYASVMGNFTLMPAAVISLKEIAYPKMLDLLNVKYIISDKPLSRPGYKLVYSFSNNIYLAYGVYYISEFELGQYPYEFIRKQNFYIYLNNNYLPRAFFIPKAIVLDREGILQRLKDKDFNPKETVLMEKGISKPLLNDGEYKEAQIEYYSPNKIKVSAYADSPGFLVLSETWYPGWKAFDNGKEVEIYRADYILRSIYLDKGKHQIDFIYDPVSFKIGLRITLAASFFVVVYLAVIFWTRKKP